MSITDNKTLVRRLYDEFFNKGIINVADDLISPNYVNHSAPPDHPPGPIGAKKNRIVFLNAFPDFHVSIEDMIAEENKVAVRFLTRATHKGIYRGIPPTGKQVTWAGVDIFVVEGGKITHGWGNFDELGLLRQLGTIS